MSVTIEVEKRKKFFFRKINLQPYIIKINHFTTNYRKSIITIAVLIFVAGIYAIPKIEVNTDSLNLLSDGKVKNDLKVIEAKLKGSTWLQLNISNKKHSSLLNDTILAKFKKFQVRLEENELVSSPVSILNFKSFLEKRTPSLFQSNSSNLALDEVMVASKQESNAFFLIVF